MVKTATVAKRPNVSGNIMGSTQIIISTLTLLFSRGQNMETPSFVFKPTAEPLSKYAEQTFTEAFFLKTIIRIQNWQRLIVQKIL